MRLPVQFLCAGLTGIMLSGRAVRLAALDPILFVAPSTSCCSADCPSPISRRSTTVPEATGRMLSERLGRWHFWLLVVGFNLTFVTMHFPDARHAAGIYTYPADRGLDG